MVMKVRVTFTRTGDRRYKVTADRDASSRVAMHPAPGYDPFIPHDLVHFVVERHWGLRDGIFGQLVAGGNAGTFHPVDEQRTRRWARDSARRNSSTGTDSTRSERLAGLVQAGWMIRTKDMSAPDNADQLLFATGGPGRRMWWDSFGGWMYRVPSCCW